MKKLILSILCIFIFVGCKKGCINGVVDKGIKVAEEQYVLMAESLIDTKDVLPRTTDKKGNIKTCLSKWWTSGFFPGTLWYLYELTADTIYRNYAEDFMKRIEKEQYTTSHHDVGFMMYCSYGNALRINPIDSSYYKKVLIQSANSLITRYDPYIGLIKSWDGHKDKWQYPVIIDNMMNLELLMWAYKETKDEKYKNIACSHADKTMVNHFRPDYSSYHLISYDKTTGKPEKKVTVQGYSDDSAWARGQAWGLYGYTMMYRETNDEKYLKQAESIANFIINHPNLPTDKVPYWDFNDPDIPNVYRDASAAAIMASALIELSQYVNEELSKKYLNIAKKQLQSLTSDHYLAEVGTNANFILKHSVGNLPSKSEIDVPLAYADYYYIEALLRYKNLMK